MNKDSFLYFLKSAPWKHFFFEATLFLGALALGVLNGCRLRFIFSQSQFAAAPVSVWQLFLTFIIGTAVLIFFAYYFRLKKWRGRFFKILFYFTLFFGNFFFFALWLPGISPLIIASLLLFIFFKKPFVFLHNLVVILAISSVGAGFGLQLEPLFVVLMLLVFALYDFLAVYLTKHMVKLAGVMVESYAVMGLIIPKTIQDFESPLKNITQKGRFMILGAGDVVFPLVLAAAMLKQGIFASLLICLFALLGLLSVFLIFVFQQGKHPLPALPPIALFCSLGYFLSLLW